MKDVEAVLAQKADNLWRRGQAELNKLQHERKQVVTCLRDLQDCQEQLLAEHTAMRSALVDITTKLEFVATEMREAIRSMPQRASGWPVESSSANMGQHAVPFVAPMPQSLAGVSCSTTGFAKSPSCIGLQSPGHHAASTRGLPAACAAAAAACVAAQAAPPARGRSLLARSPAPWQRRPRRWTSPSRCPRGRARHAGTAAEARHRRSTRGSTHQGARRCCCHWRARCPLPRRLLRSGHRLVLPQSGCRLRTAWIFLDQR